MRRTRWSRSARRCALSARPICRVPSCSGCSVCRWWTCRWCKRGSSSTGWWRWPVCVRPGQPGAGSRRGDRVDAVRARGQGRGPDGARGALHPVRPHRTLVGSLTGARVSTWSVAAFNRELAERCSRWRPVERRGDGGRVLPGYTGTLVRDGYLAKQAVAEAKPTAAGSGNGQVPVLRAAYAGAVAAGWPPTPRRRTVARNRPAAWSNASGPRPTRCCASPSTSRCLSPSNGSEGHRGRSESSKGLRHLAHPAGTVRLRRLRSDLATAAKRRTRPTRRHAPAIAPPARGCRLL